MPIHRQAPKVQVKSRSSRATWMLSDCKLITNLHKQDVGFANAVPLQEMNPHEQGFAGALQAIKDTVAL